MDKPDSWHLLVQMESSMTRYFASCGTEWKRDVERPSTWSGRAQVRKHRRVSPYCSVNLCQSTLKKTCLFVYLPLVRPSPRRWLRLGSGGEGHGGLSSHSALHVWASGCRPHFSPRADWGCRFGSRLSDPTACGWAGLPGGQVSGQRLGKAKIVWL